MAGLTEQIWTLPHKWERVQRSDGNLFSRPVLDEADAFTVKIKNIRPGRTECVVRRTDLQRLIDMSDPGMRRYGRRVSAVNLESDNVRRAYDRARAAVRMFCMRIEVDRMLTFGTRAVIPLSVLCARWKRFVLAYSRATSTKFLYCAVPELHKDRSKGEHFHLHVATTGFFDLEKALPIWWALCANDAEHERNGSINVKKFVSRSILEDRCSVIAGYISKYVGKDFMDAFNKKKYWSSRIGELEVNHIILKARDWDEVQAELSERMGVQWTSILITHAGCFFFLPNERGYWFKTTPIMASGSPPF